jgi:hypothetical protein
MSNDSTAIFVSYGPGSAGMIEMTVSQQKVFKLDKRSQTFGNVLYQFRLTSTTSSINKSGFVAEA